MQLIIIQGICIKKLSSPSGLPVLQYSTSSQTTESELYCCVAISHVLWILGSLYESPSRNLVYSLLLVANVRNDAGLPCFLTEAQLRVNYATREKLCNDRADIFMTNGLFK